MLEQVVARDPGYAPAWGLLAMMMFGGDKKEKAAKEAIRLDSHNPLGYAALGGVQAARGNLAGAEDFYTQALAIDPNEPEVLDIASNRLASAGRLKEAVRFRERLRIVEPFAPVYNYVTASIFLINGQSKIAIPILEALPSAQPRNTVLARAYAAEGRYAEAADTLIAFKGGSQDRGPLEEAARYLRDGPTKVKDPQALPVWDQELSFVYLYVGTPERVLEYQERQTARYPNLGAAEVRYLWSPEFAPVRKTDRFKTFVRKMGLVDYWRQKGWPDLCRPMGADDFVCD
jgi:tetratricopeptide (TPR) repeat protein